MNNLNIDPRNRINRSLWRRGFLLIPLMLAMLALPQIAQAVTPAPDGGYPGDNTAEGDGALNSLTNGVHNTAIGFSALLENAGGGNNTATGDSALASNTSGSNNTAFGVDALLSNTSANGNTAIGSQALFRNITGTNNTASGAGALFSNTTGNDNTATGIFSLQNNNGNDDTATGFNALFSNISGAENTAMGANALFRNTTGGDNTATGIQALYNNGNGSSNTASGGFALFSNQNGSFNTASGLNALRNNAGGSSNTAAGIQALNNNTSGSNNTALGALAGQNLTTGNNNIDIGANVLGTAGESGKIRIGKQGTQNGTFIAGIFGVTMTGSPVVVSSSGKLGISGTSSARFKTAIKAMDKASEAILALKPVTFRYKEEIDPDGIPQFGLVAEEVEKVNPDLITRDEEGKPTAVRYEAVNAMLLNEFLKEHRKVERLEGIVTQQEKQIEVLTATVQKVGDQVALSRPAPQLVANH